MVGFLVWAVVTALQNGSWSIKVTHWQVGSPTVSGTVINGTKQGCSDTRITLHERDHNDAIVSDFEFGAGEVSAHETKQWTTQVVGLLLIPAPVPSNVVSVDAEVNCADRH